MKRWLPRLPLLLTGIAEVGALLPFALLIDYLVPKEGPIGPTWHLPLPGGALSPLLLLLIWLGSWWISDRARRRQAVLTPLLLAGGVALYWFARLPAERPATYLFIVLLLPVLVVAWWGGGAIGATGLYWHTAFGGLKRSLWICLLGLLVLWLGGPPVASPFTGPFLLFGAGLTSLFLLRLNGAAIPMRTAMAALAPMLVVALLASLANPAWLGTFFGIVGSVLGPVVRVVAIPFGYVAAWINYWVLLLRARRGPMEPPPEQEVLKEPMLRELTPEQGQWVVSFTAWFLFVLILVGLWILMRSLGSKSKETGDNADPDEVRTGPGLLKGLLRDLRALRGAQSDAPEDQLPANHPRRLLRRLQLWGASTGRSRGAAETPLQYAQALAGRLPQTANPVALQSLTDAYSATRYGSGDPDVADLQAAERLLKELEQP